MVAQCRFDRLAACFVLMLVTNVADLSAEQIVARYKRRQRCVDGGFSEMMVQQAPEYRSFFGYPQIAAAVQADPSALRDLFSPR